MFSKMLVSHRSVTDNTNIGLRLEFIYQNEALCVAMQNQLTPDLLLYGYQQGVFPMADPDDKDYEF